MLHKRYKIACSIYTICKNNVIVESVDKLLVIIKLCRFGVTQRRVEMSKTLKIMVDLKVHIIWLDGW